DPAPGSVALENSFGAYGFASGLLLGVTMDPPDPRAYALNAFLGGSAGLVVGAVVAPRLHPSRARMAWVDVGASLGAASAWITIFPIAKMGGANDSEASQVTGVFSVATLGVGAYLAWRWSEGVDGREHVPGPAALASLGE